MKQYKLNKHVRYREEDRYILLCDCKRLLDFEFPAEYIELLKKLENGDTPKNKLEKDVIKEFENLKLLEMKSHGNKSEEDIFKNLTYDEREFF